MDVLGAYILAACCVSMIWIFALYAWSSPSLLFPLLEYSKTKDERDVFWVEDHRHRTVSMRFDFETGVGDCAHVVQASWNLHHEQMKRDLLKIGGEARFQMGSSRSFLELTLYPGFEAKGLDWMRRWIYDAKIYETASVLNISSDIIPEILYGNVRWEEDVHVCKSRYQKWKKGSAPRYIFWGSVNTKSILPKLNFFWKFSEEHASWKMNTSSFKPRHNLIVNEERGSLVEVYLLIPIPDTADVDLIRAYRNVLNGFAGRLVMTLREEKGWVYDVKTKIHYGTQIFLEIHSECSMEDLSLVRDELYSIIYGMRKIEDRELIRLNMQKVRRFRERMFSGMPDVHVLTHEQREKKYKGIISKLSLEELAQKINKNNDFVWVLRGTYDEIITVWPSDWKLFTSKKR